MLLEFSQLSLKTLVRVGLHPTFLAKSLSVVKRKPVEFDEVRNHHGYTAGDPLLAMHQDISVLADPHFLQELKGQLDTSRQGLRGIVGHGQAAIVEVFVLLMVVHHATKVSRHGAIENILYILQTQFRCVPRIVGVSDIYPVQLLMLEGAHLRRLEFRSPMDCLLFLRSGAFLGFLFLLNASFILRIDVRGRHQFFLRHRKTDKGFTSLHKASCSPRWLALGC